MSGAEAQTAQFLPGPTVGVFTEDGERVQPGSGDKGLVAVSGFIPVGYYKDPEKSAKTFRTFEGQRWSVPGDFAEINEDGTRHILVAAGLLSCQCRCRCLNGIRHKPH